MLLYHELSLFEDMSEENPLSKGTFFCLKGKLPNPNLFLK